MTEQQTAELLEYVKQGVEFGKDQAPILVEEILQYGWISNWVYLSLGCLLLLCIAVGLMILVKSEEDCIQATGLGMMIVGLIVGIPITISSVIDLVQIHFAPRLYVMKELTGMLVQQ